MFTGIIEGLGKVTAASRTGGGVSMEIQAEFPLDKVKIGDSIAVNGTCLTVVDLKKNAFRVDVSPETLDKSTLGKAKVSDRVNLEQALRLGDRLGGHLVSGHIDGIGMVKAKQPMGNAILFSFDVPADMSRYIISKGSIAVDGISLTVNTCDQSSFQVSVIPHTAKATNLGFRKVGDMVNIETDMVGKYIERLTQKVSPQSSRAGSKDSSVDEMLLKKAGFM